MGFDVQIVAHTFALSGTVSMIETACSASNVAFSCAYQKLRMNRDARQNLMLPANSTHSQQALVLSLNYADNPMPFVGMSQAHMLGALGRCLSLDNSANGFCRGEGAGAAFIELTRKGETSLDK